MLAKDYLRYCKEASTSATSRKSTHQGTQITPLDSARPTGHTTIVRNGAREKVFQRGASRGNGSKQRLVGQKDGGIHVGTKDNRGSVKGSRWSHVEGAQGSIAWTNQRMCSQHTTPEYVV